MGSRYPFEYALPFFSAAFQKRYAEQQQAAIDRALQHAVDWDEDKTKFSSFLPLRGSTFDMSRYWVFNSQPGQFDGQQRCENTPGLVWSPQRNFAYLNRILPGRHELDLFQGHRRGKVAFDSDVVVPVLYRHKHNFDVWIGLTPAEILSQRQGVRLAQGHVLLGGLGLGWLLRKVAAKKTVKKITVVEISDELLQWYGHDMCQRVAAETGKEITVICGDVLEHMGKHGSDVRHIIDIWPDFPTYVTDLPKPWREAIGSVQHFWGWGVLSDPADYRY